MGTTAVNGVTYVNASGPVSFADISAAFGGKNKASQLRGLKWYQSNFTRGNFPSSGNLSLSSLRSRGGNIPRISSADRAVYTNDGLYKTSGGFTLPNGFNKINIVLYGASGGGGGGNGVTCLAFNQFGQCTIPVNANGAAGTAGQATSTTLPNGASISAGGGGGGNQGANGANGANTTGFPGQAGGTGNGNGGAGGLIFYELNADADYAAIAALFSGSFSPTYGARGSGGAGGGNYQPGSTGNNGLAGVVAVFIDQNLY